MVVLLSACATHPLAPVLRPAKSETADFAINGRILAIHNGSRASAGIRWTHQSQSDEILLLTPLGQTAARIFRDETHATLDEGEKHYTDTDVESLMMRVLGWRLQLNSLHHWLLGIASGVHALIDFDELGRPIVVRQDGWEVRYLQYAGNKGDSLPVRMQLSRDNLQLTLLVDEWEWNPE